MDEQLEFIEDVSGSELFELFKSSLNAATEDEAKERIDALSHTLRNEPLKAFKMYNRLNAEQKDIILGLLEDERE
jgi:hypothetical protein